MAAKKEKAPAKKAAAKKDGAKKGAPKKENSGKIFEIIQLHKKGLTNAQIIEKGYNKSTVGIQVAKYKRGEGPYAK